MKDRTMTHYDDLETRSADERAADLPAMLGRAIANAKLAPGFARALRDVEPQDIASTADLARLPVLRKSELSEAQGKRRPFGGFTTRRTAEFDHVAELVVEVLKNTEPTTTSKGEPSKANYKLADGIADRVRAASAEMLEKNPLYPGLELS